MVAFLFCTILITYPFHSARKWEQNGRQNVQQMMPLTTRTAATVAYAKKAQGVLFQLICQFYTYSKLISNTRSIDLACKDGQPTRTLAFTNKLRRDQLLCLRRPCLQGYLGVKGGRSLATQARARQYRRQVRCSRDKREQNCWACTQGSIAPVISHFLKKRL